jgi:hypothetical protein
LFDDDQSEKISPRARLLLPLLGVLIVVVLRGMKESLARQLAPPFVSWSSIVSNGSLMTKTERYSPHSSPTDDRNDAEEFVALFSCPSSDLFEQENSIRFPFEEIGVEREMIVEQIHSPVDENLH